MARLSAIETGKKLVAEVRNVGRKLGNFGLEILRTLLNGLQVGFDWLFERGKNAYEKLEPRLAAKSALLMEWWERRGWPPSLLRLIGNALLHLPIDIGWYLLGCVEHFIGLNPPYLLAWLVFAGSVRAGRFYFKEILPDRRKAARGGTTENGTQIEGGC